MCTFNKFTLVQIIFSCGCVSIFAQQRGVGVQVQNAQGQTREITLYDGSYALVIGESEYTNGWDNLPLVKTDVAEVRRVLQNGGFTVEAEMNLTAEQLKARINRFIYDYGFGQNNRLLIYFAGHGHTQKAFDGRDLGYIIPSDAPQPDKDPVGFRRTAISEDTIRNYARQIEAKHAVFVFDSCFSGKLVSRGEFKVPPVILDDVAYPVRQFITAGAANQEVPDDSIFRKAFVRGLEGEADRNNDKFITGTELAEYLKEKVTNASDRAQTLQYGKIRDIDLDRGDFVFTISPRSTPVSPTTNEASKKAKAALLANQALSEMMLGNIKQAENLANQAMNLDDNSALGYGIRGWARNFGNDYDASRTDLEKSVRMDSNNVLFRARLSATYQNLKENELAKKTAEAAVQSLNTPKTAIEYYARGVADDILEKTDNTIQDYTKAIELDPKFILAYNNRGLAYYNKEDYEAAIRDYTKAIELDPKYVYAYNNRGNAFYEKNDYQQAVKDSSKAIEINSNYAKAYYDRAYAYDKVGETEKAKADRQKYDELTKK